MDDALELQFQTMVSLPHRLGTRTWRTFCSSTSASIIDQSAQKSWAIVRTPKASSSQIVRAPQCHGVEIRLHGVDESNLIERRQPAPSPRSHGLKACGFDTAATCCCNQKRIYQTYLSRQMPISSIQYHHSLCKLCETVVAKL